MNVNINKARGDAIIDELAKYGYEAYTHDGSAQVLIRPSDPSASAHLRTLPIELTSQLNNARGSVLIALRMRALAKRVAEVQAAVDAVPPDAIVAADATTGEAKVIRAPGFGDPEEFKKQVMNDDPILRAGEDFGAE